jgi:hypothetical protein
MVNRSAASTCQGHLRGSEDPTPRVPTRDLPPPLPPNPELRDEWGQMDLLVMDVLEFVFSDEGDEAAVLPKL